MENLVLPVTDKAITLVRVNNPLNPMLDRESKVLPYFGESLYDIKRKNFFDDIEVITSLNGLVIQEYDLPNIYLKHGDYLVFYPTIGGGMMAGGSGRDMMRSIAFLALSVVAMFAAPWLAGMIAPGLTGASGALLTGMISTTINMVGGILINALLPPTVPDEPPPQKTTYGWSPKTTQQPGVSIPVSYGRIKSHGNIIAAFNENVKYKSTTNILVGFGLGPIEDISDYKINDQRQRNAKDIQFHERHGELYQTVIPNFGDTKTENPLNVVLKYTEDYLKGSLSEGTLYTYGNKVRAYDSTGQGYVFICITEGACLLDFPSGPYTIGTTYTRGSGEAVWECVDMSTEVVPTQGNNFNALEVEIYFPRGLAFFEDTGELSLLGFEYDVEISPSGQNQYESICKSPKYGTVWDTKKRLYEKSIVVSPTYTNVYRVTKIYGGYEDANLIQCIDTGTTQPYFPSAAYSVVLESLNSDLPLCNFEDAYYYDGSTYTQIPVSRLSGDLVGGPMEFDLSASPGTKFLYCKVDSLNDNTKKGLHLMSYTINDNGVTCTIHADIRDKDGNWYALGGNLSLSADDNVDHVFAKPSSTRKWGAGTGIAGTGIAGFENEGHWIRLHYGQMLSTFPTVGMLRPLYVGNTKRTVSGIIVYVDTRLNFDGDNGLGRWSAGYYLPSGSLLQTGASIWVEIRGDDVTANDLVKPPHFEGQPYGNPNNYLQKGSYWSKKTGTGYYIPINCMEGKRKISRATTRAFWLTERSWDIFPKGYYDVRVTRNSKEAPEGSRTTSNEAYLSNIREIVYDDFSYPRQALLGVKALATDKLSGNLDLSAVVTGKVVKVYRPDEVRGTDGYNYQCISGHTAATQPPGDSTNWRQGGSSAVENNIDWVSGTTYSSDYYWISEYSTNPAWVCYDLLSQPVLGLPSEAMGSDNRMYECVISHTYTSANVPITGANWSRFWQNGGDVYGDSTITAVGQTYVARPVVREEGVESTRIDTASFRTWADYCDELVYDENGTPERRHEFNGIFDNEESLWEAALKVCEMSRTSLIWNGINIAAVSDKEIDVPGDVVQLFSSGNTVPDSFQEMFLPVDERIGEIEINFLNRNKDWERDTVSIYNSSYLRPSNKTSIDAIGITKSSQAWRHARYMINCNKELKRTIQFETDIEAIACTIGDVFYFQNDTPRWGLAGGRIDSFSTPTTITLDQTITMSATQSYGIMLRLQDDTVMTKPLNSYTGSFNTVTATTAFAKLPKAYDPYSIGLSGYEAKAFRVVNISQSSEHRAKITAIEYKADVFTDDAINPHVDDTEWPGEQEPILPVYDLTVREIPASQTIPTRDLEITFSRPRDCVKYRTAKVLYSSSPADRGTLAFDDWTELINTSDTRVILPNATIGNRYNICVISVNDEGIESLWEDSPMASLVVSGLSFASKNVEDVRVTGLQILGAPNSTTFTGKDCKLEWNPVITIFPNMVAGQDSAVSIPTAMGVSFSSTMTYTTYDMSGTPLENVTKSSYAAGAGTATPQTWFKDYEVKVYNGGVLKRVDHVVDPIYNYTYEKNFEDNAGTPTRSFKVEVAARDVTLRKSNSSFLDCYNPPPSAPTFTSRDTRTGFEIEIDPVLDTDIGGYKVWYSQTLTNFSSTATVIADGLGTKISYESGIGKVYVQLQAYDVFGATE